MMLAKEKEKKKGGSSASGGVGWYYRRYPPRIIAASLCHRTQPPGTSSCSGKVVLDSLVLARVPALKRSCVCGSVRVKGPRAASSTIYSLASGVILDVAQLWRMTNTV